MGNVLRRMFKTDEVIERKGIWVEYAEGVEILIARAGGANKKFAKVMTRLAKPHRRAIQTEAVDESILQAIFLKAYSRAVILDWKGITKDIITGDDADAETELTFNEENCVEVLKALPDLFVDLQKASDNISLFRAEVLETDSKN